jgi:hypothetical protein
MFVLVCVVLCCRVQERPQRWANHSSKGVVPNVLIRLRNLRCEAAKVLNDCRATDDDEIVYKDMKLHELKNSRQSGSASDRTQPQHFAPSPHLNKSFIEQNDYSNKTCRHIILQYTKLHLCKYNGS